jgi:hypothetical protein
VYSVVESLQLSRNLRIVDRALKFLSLVLELDGRGQLVRGISEVFHLILRGTGICYQKRCNHSRNIIIHLSTDNFTIRVLTQMRHDF